MCDFEGAARVRLTQLAQEAFGEDEAKTLKSIFMQQQISQTKTQRAEGIMLKRAESLSPRTAGVSAMQSSLSRSAESLQLKAKSTSGSDLTASAPLDSGNTKNSVLVAQNLIQLEATKLATVALRDFVGCKWLTSTDFIDITAYLDLCERVCRDRALSFSLVRSFSKLNSCCARNCVDYLVGCIRDRLGSERSCTSRHSQKVLQDCKGTCSRLTHSLPAAILSILTTAISFRLSLSLSLRNATR